MNYSRLLTAIKLHSSTDMISQRSSSAKDRLHSGPETKPDPGEANILSSPYRTIIDAVFVFVQRDNKMNLM